MGSRLDEPSRPAAGLRRSSMNRLAARIGMWTAIAESLVSLVYVVGLVILIAAALSRSPTAELAAQ